MTRSIKLVKANSADNTAGPTSVTTDYKLLHREEKKKCSKLELDNERLRRSVEVLQRSLEAKNADIESKDALINKLLEKGLSKATSLYATDAENSSKKDVEDLDIDSLLQANFGDFDNFESVLDLSGTGNILPTDLPDVTCDWGVEAANISVSIKEMIPCLNTSNSSNTSPQVPNRDGNLVVGEESSSSLSSISSSASGTLESKVKEDPTIVSRLVDQHRNFAVVQTKVSPLKIVLDKKRTPLIKRKQISPLRQIPQKNIRLDQVPKDGSEENFSSHKRIKLEKSAARHELQMEKKFSSNRNRVNDGIITKQRRSSDETIDQETEVCDKSSQRKKSSEPSSSDTKNHVDFKIPKKESQPSKSNKHASKPQATDKSLQSKNSRSNTISQHVDGDSCSSHHLKRERKSDAKNDSSSQSSSCVSRRRPSSTSDSERKSSKLACADPSKSKYAPRDTNSTKQSRETFSSHHEQSSSNTSFRCPYCGKQFPRGGEWKMRKHIASEHGDQEKGLNRKKQFTCHKCSAEFSSNSVLMSHMERHRRSPWKKDPWKCGACREKFTEMKQLAKHVKQYHGVKKWEKASKLVKF